MPRYSAVCPATPHCDGPPSQNPGCLAGHATQRAGLAPHPRGPHQHSRGPHQHEPTAQLAGLARRVNYVNHVNPRPRAARVYHAWRGGRGGRDDLWGFRHHVRHVGRESHADGLLFVLVALVHPPPSDVHINPSRKSRSVTVASPRRGRRAPHLSQDSAAASQGAPLDPVAHLSLNRGSHVAAVRGPLLGGCLVTNRECRCAATYPHVEPAYPNLGCHAAAVHSWCYCGVTITVTMVVLISVPFLHALFQNQSQGCRAYCYCYC